MNWNQIEGQWSQMKGKVKERWTKLTEEDLSEGRRDKVLISLQKRYGLAKDEAERQLDEFSAKVH